MKIKYSPVVRQLADGILSMDYFVYAIYNKEANKIYIGQTTSVGRRVEEHNKKRGKHFTSTSNGEWKLVYKEKCELRKKAIIRERELKSYQGRKYIKNLITNIPL